MKKIFKSILFLTSLLLTSCLSGNHTGSRVNYISSLFEEADKSLNQNSETSVEVTSGEETNNSEEITNSIEETSSTYFPTYDKIDVDLTTMNATMVYSQVYNMLNETDEYIGKVIKMQGPFVPFDSTNPDYCYPAIVIRDATACCSSGIEFLLYGVPRCSKAGGNGYPLRNEEATIVGVFETYYEGAYMYVHLVDAIWLEGLNQ